MSELTAMSKLCVVMRQKSFVTVKTITGMVIMRIINTTNPKNLYET